jgi:hypothetical protein
MSSSIIYHDILTVKDVCWNSDENLPFFALTYGTGTKLLVWLLNFFDWEEDPDPDAQTRF